MSIGDCVGKTIEKTSEHGHLVVVVPETRLKEALKYASVSVPEGSWCGGTTWITPTGKKITVASINAKPFNDEFSLALCGWGDRDHSPQWERLKRWKKASDKQLSST
jgi:hypothetical protein